MSPKTRTRRQRAAVRCLPADAPGLSGPAAVRAAADHAPLAGLAVAADGGRFDLLLRPVRTALVWGGAMMTTCTLSVAGHMQVEPTPGVAVVRLANGAVRLTGPLAALRATLAGGQVAYHTAGATADTRATAVWVSLSGDPGNAADGPPLSTSITVAIRYE